MSHGIVVVIPARYASTRLPGKPLLEIGGKPMIQWVYERAARAAVERVVVATDDQRVAAAVAGFGGEAVMTGAEHTSGTDRVAEAVRLLGGGDLVVNVQGDEPLLEPAMVDQALAPLLEDAAIPMGTLAHPLHTPLEYLSPDVVKVTVDVGGFAIAFSRSPIPYHRDRFGSVPPATPEGLAAAGGVPPGMLRHIGLYVYRGDFLQAFTALAPTPLERTERLEQLRALENGHRIRVAVTDLPVIGVDTPADLERVRGLYREGRFAL